MSLVFYGGATPPGKTRLALLLPVLLASVVLKRVVEDPLRRRRTPATTSRHARWPARPYVVIAAAMVLVVPLSLAGWVTTTQRVDAAKADLATFTAAAPACYGALTRDAVAPCTYVGTDDAAVPDPIVAVSDFPYGRCQQNFTSSSLTSCVIGTGEKSMFIVGDSHITEWIPAVLPWARQNGYTVTTFLKSACALQASAVEASCASWNSKVQAEVASKHPALVLVSSQSAPDGHPTTSAAKHLTAAWRTAQDAGAQVVALRDSPQPELAGRANIPVCLLRSTRSACGFSRASATRGDVVTLAIPLTKDVGLLDLTDAFCSETCQAVIGGTVVYLDGSHITGTYSASLAPAFSRAMAEAVPG